MAASSTFDRIGRMLPAITAAICGFAIFWVISSFQKGVPQYNRAVADSILLSATLLLPLVFLAGSGDKPRLQPQLIIAFSVVVLVVVASTVMSPNIFEAASRLRMYYSLLVFGVVLYILLRQIARPAALEVLLMIAMVHMFFLMVALRWALATDQVAPAAAPPFFSNPRHFGYHGFLGAASALSLVVLDRRFRLTGIVLATSALFGIALFGSRGALVAWIMFVMVLTVLLANRKRFLGMAALVLAGAMISVYYVEQADVFHTTSIFDRQDLAAGDSILAMESRLSIWRDSAGAIASRPMLGFGPEGFRTSACCIRRVVQPHNVVLQVLLEFGLVGFGSLVWLCWIAFRAKVVATYSCGRGTSPDSGRAALLAILAGFLCFGLIDGVFYHVLPLIHLAVLVALFMASPATKLENTQASQSPASSPDTATA